MRIQDKFSAIKDRQLIFTAAAVILSLFTWFSLYLAFYQIYSGFSIWIISLALIFLMSVIISIGFFIIESKKLAVISYAFVSLPTFLFFGWRGYELVGIFVFFLTMVAGYIFVKREEGWLIKFMYIRLVRRGLPIFFTGFALALAIFYNASPLGGVFERPQIPKTIFEIALTPIEYMARAGLPGFDKNMNVGDIEKLTSRELPGLFNIPPAVLSGFTRDFFAGVSEEVKSKNLAQFLTETTNSQLDSMLQPYKQFLPIVFLFGLFLVFKAISVPLMWLSILISWILIKALLRFKVLHIIKVDAKKEELAL